MYATLQEVRDSRVAVVAGCCPTSDDFTSIVNTVVRRAMRRGDWPGLVVPIHTCIHTGCVVWPRYVGEVRKINLCNQAIPIKNEWFEFLQYSDAPWRSAGNRYYNNWWGTNWWGSWCGSPATAVMQGKSPVFQDMLGEGRLVRAYASARNDVGKTVTIFGTDNNGQTLYHRDVDDNFVEGAVLTLTTPFASTDTYVRHIDRVLLDDMTGDVRLYGYNATTDLLEDIATYAPGDTNPAFERYKLQITNCQSGSCGCSHSVVALVKLKYVPARFPNDLILIDNLDALALGVKSVRLEEAGDRAGAREYEQDMIRELNLGLGDASPLDTIPVRVSTFEGTGTGRQKLF